MDDSRSPLPGETIAHARAEMRAKLEAEIADLRRLRQDLTELVAACAPAESEAG